jgi:hypothetical protein
MKIQKYSKNGIRPALVLLSGLCLSTVAWAQDATDPAVEEGPTGPSVAESVTFINEQLAASPSTWRPCQESTVLSVDDQGRLSFEISRANYCEHSRQTAHLLDLDPDAIEVANEQEMVIRVACVEGAECGRYWEKRKKRLDDAWTLRDTDWRPLSQFKGRTHKVTGVELFLSSDERYAQRLAEGIQYMLTVARTDPAFAEPKPFGTPEEPIEESGETP